VADLALGTRVEQHRAVGAVGEGRQHRQNHVRAGAEDYRGAGGDHVAPERVAVETPIQQDQHGRVEIGHQPRGQGAFADADRSQFRCREGVRAALAETDHPHGGERAFAPAAAGVFEFRVVLRRIRNVEDDTINSHDPPGSEPRSAGARPGHRHGDAPE
jgi:hypothetical protein